MRVQSGHDLEELPAPEPGRLRRRITAGVVAFAVFGVAVALASGVITDHAAPEPISAGWNGYAEGWTELPPPPEWRDGAAIVWTGHELLYWGGSPSGNDGTHGTADGFAFDPATRAWSAMPPAPRLGLNALPIWTGSEALFLSIEEEGVRGQAFDPASGTWRTLPGGPQLPRYGVSSVWTGQELILFGGGSVGAPSNEQAWSFDPRSGDWRRLADAPFGMNLSDAAWTGAEVVVVGSTLDNRHEATSRTAQAEAYDPVEDRWRALAPPPISAQTAAVGSVDGTLVAWELYGPDSVGWLPDETRWRSIDMGGFGGGECYAASVVVDASLFTWNCGSPAAWFAATDNWVPVDRPIEAESGFSYSFGRAFPAGDAAVVDETETIAGAHGEPYVGSPDAPEHLWVWKPPSVAPSSTWTPTRSDAVDAVGNFLSNWSPGWEAFLSAEASADVIDRCRVGEGGLVELRNGAVPNWNLPSAPVVVDQDTFEVTVELLRDHAVVGTEIFTLGSGTTADGRVGQLVITDVRSA